MVARIPPVLLAQVGLTMACFPSWTNGQIFTRAPLEAPPAIDLGSATNVSCGMSSCPPQALTHGYFHEHWRRWPEEPSLALPADLSPFVRPPRDLPAVRPPAQSEEDSLAPPRRGIGGPDAAAGAERRPPAPATPSVTPTPAPPRPGIEGTELPSEPPSGATPPEGTELPSVEPAEPPGDSGFFPIPDDDEGGESPEAFPDLDLDSTLPPADQDLGTPSETPGVQPPAEDADDVFDLDDFSRADPRRMHRYRMSSSGQLRRSRTSATPARVHSRPMATRRPPVQLAGYRHVVDGRSNPLRSNSMDEYAVSADGPTDLDARSSVASDWDRAPVDLDRVERPARPLDWTPPKQSSHRTRGRSNPLR